MGQKSKIVHKGIMCDKRIFLDAQDKTSKSEWVDCKPARNDNEGRMTMKKHGLLILLVCVVIYLEVAINGAVALTGSSTLSGVISSPEYIKERKEAKAKKDEKTKAKAVKAEKQVKTKTDKEEMKNSDDPNLDDTFSDWENECVGCGKDYRSRKKTAEWIQCNMPPFAPRDLISTNATVRVLSSSGLGQVEFLRILGVNTNDNGLCTPPAELKCMDATVSALIFIF
ncbi:hypothetical protein FQA39_LY08723 [Lamprigera yunnana]|nr:hypothetical protein FQA39_LY08723 [Lamprigera yunnana]